MIMKQLIICFFLSLAFANDKLKDCRLVDKDFRGQPRSACKCGERQCKKFEECVFSDGNEPDLCRRTKPDCIGDSDDEEWGCVCGERQCEPNESCKKVDNKLECIEKPVPCEKAERDKFNRPVNPCTCSYGKPCKKHEYCLINRRGDNIDYCISKYPKCKWPIEKDTKSCICGGKVCRKGKVCKWIKGKEKCLKDEDENKNSIKTKKPKNGRTLRLGRVD